MHAADENSDPQRARDAARHWLPFFARERSAGRIVRGPMVSDITPALSRRYINWRKEQPGSRKGTTISGATISRELAALRASLKWAEHNHVIVHAPFVPDVAAKEASPPREMTYTRKEIAALLEAAARLPERAHILRFIIIMCSTNGRVEAVLDLDAVQIDRNVIDFLVPGAVQTKKRRSAVPIAPTLRPWLKGVTGKVIRYQTVKIDAKTGKRTVKERHTASIKTAFGACLIEAGICDVARDEKGKPIMIAPRRKLGETRPRSKLVPRGSPNVLRHTINTEFHRLGIPEAQIEESAGHRGRSTNKKNYRHMRPEYLRDFIVGVEKFWKAMDRFTQVHRNPPSPRRA